MGADKDLADLVFLRELRERRREHGSESDLP
jgi:hypothetical protein